MNKLFYLIIALVIMSGINNAYSQDKDFNLIKSRIVKKLTASCNEKYVEKLLSTLNSDGSWNGINYKSKSMK